MAMSQPGCSPIVRKETFHTVSLVWPHLAPGMSVLDVGCGEGWVAEELVRRGIGDVAVVDVVDVRRARTLPFWRYDGVHLPFDDARFDVAMLNFVLHHVPDERKVALLREALRVARRTVFILEDTPVTPLDRFVSRRHGEAYRRKIAGGVRSAVPAGFRARRFLAGDDELVVASFPLPPASQGRPHPPLTAAEREVLAALLDGKSYAAIARGRRRSVNTVAKQIGSAFRKLGVSSRGELAARGILGARDRNDADGG